MVKFVFFCFEEYMVELSETENYCRMGKQPLKNRRASLRSGYRSCEFSSENPFLPRHGIHNRVNNTLRLEWDIHYSRGL